MMNEREVNMSNNVISMEEYRNKLKAREEAEYIRVMRDPVNHGNDFCTCSYNPRNENSKKEKQ